jgi:hypothetical protein
VDSYLSLKGFVPGLTGCDEHHEIKNIAIEWAIITAKVL